MSEDRITFRDDLDELHDDDTVVEDPEIRRAKLVLFLAAITLGVLVIIILLVFFQPEGQEMKTYWPNGYPRASTTYVTGTKHPNAPASPSTERDGLVEHGLHRAWHENGQLAEEGNYEQGYRVGRWSFWDEDGNEDPQRSGNYEAGWRADDEPTAPAGSGTGEGSESREATDPSETEPSEGADSPEAIIAIVNEAEASGEFGMIFPLILPEQRPMVLIGAWFGAAHRQLAMTTDSRVVGDYQEMLARHGLDETYLSAPAAGEDAVRALAEEALRGVDQQALFQDLFEFQANHGETKKASGMSGAIDGRQLSEDGSEATLGIGEGEVRFSLREGRWYWRFLG